MDNLQENSLFKDQEEYNKIIQNPEKVADIAIFNFFGFLSLFSIGARGDVKKYSQLEGSVYQTNINNANRDASIAIKMLFDAKLSPTMVTDKMAKLLALVKNHGVKPSSIKDEFVKELLIESKLTTVHKPSTKLKMIVDRWVKGEITLAWLAMYLYKLARLPEYKDITAEFIAMYKTGQYANVYRDIINMKHPESFIPNDVGGSTDNGD